MTLRSDAYSPKAFEFFIGVEDGGNVGTADVGALYSLDVDSVGFPSLNPITSYDVRSGVGETAKLVDAFRSNKGTVKEITVSGNYWDATMELLAANITGDATSDHQVAYNHTGKALKHGDSVSDATSTFTVVVNSPLSNSAMIFPGCVVTALSFSGDMGTEGGRVKFSATFKTGHVPSLSGSTASAATLYSAGTGADMNAWTLTTLGGVADTVMQSFSLNIEHDAVFLGFDTSGNAEVISRTSEFITTLDAQIVYNTDSEALINEYEAGAAFTSTGAINCSNNGTIGSVTGFGFHIDHSVVTNCALSEGDVMMLDTSWKALASTSGSILELVCE